MIELTLPFPPSVNRYWRHTIINDAPRTLISREGRAFRKAVCEAVCMQLPWPRKSFCKPVLVVVRLYPPDRRKRDIDNGLKALFDALTEAEIWLDDVVVKKLDLALSGKTVKGGQAKIQIEELPPGWDEE